MCDHSSMLRVWLETFRDPCDREDKTFNPWKRREYLDSMVQTFPSDLALPARRLALPGNPATASLIQAGGDAAMALRTTGSVFVVFLCSVAGVSSQNVWSVNDSTKWVCALKGSSVVLSCSYYYPRGHTVTRTGWCRWKYGQGYTYDIQDQPEYAGRVQYLWDEKGDCSLTITDLRDTDSGSYYFTFQTAASSHWQTGSEDINLSVTALQVTVTGQYGKTLTCSSTCTVTGSISYTWYKNNKILQGETRKQYSRYVSSTDVNSYSCAVSGHKDLPSPAVCASGQNCWSVNYSTRRVCALKGSSVDLSCTYTHPTDHNITKTFWFKVDHYNQGTITDLNDDYEYTHRVVKDNSRKVNHHTLTITDLRQTDSAEYKFRMITDKDGKYYGSPGVQLSVTDIQVEIDRTSVTEGEKVSLTCKTTCPLGLNTSWFRNGKPVTNRKTRQEFLYLDPVSREDAGRYSCAVTEHLHLRSPEETVNVMYKPRNLSVSVSPSGAVVEGSSVTLTCSSDANPPVQTYTWYQENIPSSKSPGQNYTITNITSEEFGQNYTITDIRSEDSGRYFCQARNTVGATNSSVVMIPLLTGMSAAQAAAVGTTVSVLLAVILLSVCLLCRKKTSKLSPANRQPAYNEQGDFGPVYDNVLAIALTHRDTHRDTHTHTDTAQQHDVHYTSVNFSRSQTQDVPLYSTIQSVQPQNQEENVQYAAVKFNRLNPAPRVTVQTTEDSSELYSTVNRART